MNYNNKGQASSKMLFIFLGIMLFSLISLIYVIVSYLFFAVGNDYIVLPLYDSTENFNTTSQIEKGFENTVSSYQSTDLSFIDNMWLFGYFVLVITSFSIAYQTKSTNYFSWISMLVYGLMVVLFIAGLFLTILQFLYDDILLKLFLNLAVDTPFLNYFITNFGIILMLHAAGLLLVNMVDFDFSFIRNRKDKEIKTLDDEII